MLNVLFVTPPKPPSRTTNRQPAERQPLEIAGFGSDENRPVFRVDRVEEAEKRLQSQFLGVWLELEVGEDEEGARFPGLAEQRALGEGMRVGMEINTSHCVLEVEMNKYQRLNGSKVTSKQGSADN